MRSNIGSRSAFFIVVSLLIISAVCFQIAQLKNSAKAQTNNQRQLRQPTSTNMQWPDKAKRYALIIGVDEYQDSQINRLTGATNDAKALSDVLIQYAGFSKDQLILLASNEPPERRPNRGNILQRLSNLKGLVPKDGLLLISFAGHGIERNGQAYLLPEDARVSEDIALIEATAINADLIKNWVRETGIGQVVIILDACRNNPTSGRGDGSNPLTDKYMRGFNFDARNKEVTAFVTLYATGVNNVAYEYKEKKQGYFTWALVEGLKGAAANPSGDVTLASLIAYLQEIIPKKILLDLGQGKVQRPIAVIEGYKAQELIISTTAKTTAQQTPSMPAPSVDIATNEINLWETIKSSSNARDFDAYVQQYPKGRYVELAKERSRRLSVETGDPISGTWLCALEPGGFQFTLKLKMTGGAVTGEHIYEGMNSPVTIGKWTGNDLEIRLTHNRSNLRMTAVIKDGQLIGKRYIDGSTTPLIWTATKQLIQK